MKRIKICFASLAAVLLLAGSGCKKNKFDINRNTNNPTDTTVTYDVVLPAALHATGASIVASQWGTIQNWMGYWARSGTYAPNLAEETYQVTTSFNNGVWNQCFDNNYDYQVVINKAKIAGASFYEGIARIMKAHNFQILVDVYGNIPYRDALQGNRNPTPRYDLGIDVYKDLFRQIDTGMALIRNAEVTATNANKQIWLNDILFRDSIEGKLTDVPNMKRKWAQFGNSLKLRMLVHAYAVAGIDKAAEIARIEAEGSGYMEGNAEVHPGYQSDKPNPFYTLYRATPAGASTAQYIYFRANEWGIGYYGANGDPRRPRFYENGTKGVAYGLPPVEANAAANLAAVGPGLYRSAVAPQLVLSAAEVFFLRAEARFRGIITTGPSTDALLEAGKLASFKYLGLDHPDTDLAAYNSNNAGYPDVDLASGPAPGAPAGSPAGGLYTIISQKWFALNGIASLEVWTDYRRIPYTSVAATPNASTTHFVYGQGVGYNPGPPISVAPQNTSTSIPVRYLYPQTEYNYNAANVGAQGVIDPFTSRIFWDLN